MISYKDLIYNPEKYQPLSSHKSVFNKESEPNFANVDLEVLFRSNANQISLTKSLFKTSRHNGCKASIDKFAKLIPVAQIKFCQRYDISQYEMAEQQASEERDWAELLRVVNNDFLKFCYNLLQWNSFNPFRERTMVGPSDNRRSKKFNELLAHDIPTIDVYADVNIERKNSQYWLENKFPTWRAHQNVRHFDYDGGGYRNGDRNRASLETIDRGFDMTTVNGLLDKWHSKDWFGL
jgi:hypothetical protein